MTGVYRQVDESLILMHFVAVCLSYLVCGADSWFQGAIAVGAWRFLNGNNPHRPLSCFSHTYSAQGGPLKKRQKLHT